MTLCGLVDRLHIILYRVSFYRVWQNKVKIFRSLLS